jgi:hypothetical protein
LLYRAVGEVDRWLAGRADGRQGVVNGRQLAGRTAISLQLYAEDKLLPTSLFWLYLVAPIAAAPLLVDDPFGQSAQQARWALLTLIGQHPSRVLKQVSSLGSWLFRSAHNRAIGYTRHYERRVSDPGLPGRPHHHGRPRVRYSRLPLCELHRSQQRLRRRSGVGCEAPSRAEVSPSAAQPPCCVPFLLSRSSVLRTAAASFCGVNGFCKISTW